MSSRIAVLVALCEDQRHRSFLNFYLEALGVGAGNPRWNVAPAGVGSAEQWVRDNYARELQAFRSAINRRRGALIVIIDSDQMEPGGRIRQMEVALRAANVEMPAPEEAVVLLIPKRNIETWIIALGAAIAVDERQDHRNDARTKDRRVIRDSARALYELTRPNAPLPESDLPSLIAGIEALRRFESVLRGSNA